ncbi:MAG: histidine phosphatase family protein, partial [Micrococcales bacterium]|nr:histidine phosphatase family protein [Micrococcales bacterium]
MGAERAVIWRHGQTAYNKARRIQGQSDIPLDETGLAQAATAAEQLVELEPGAIVSSDLVRAAATAGALAALTGLEVSLDTRLRERNFGDWEGESAANLHERWPAEFALWRQGHDIESIGMERRSKAAARVAAAV